MRGIKKTNEYANLLKEFRKIPKSVLAAIAVSKILKDNSENFETVEDLLFDEWDALYHSKIVQQKPAKRI